MSFSAVIVAAGSGRRAGGAKQWRDLRGKAVARWSVEAFLAAGAKEIVLVIPPGDQERAAEALAGLRGWRAVEGGAERRDSVLNGLAALDCPPEQPVLVHDAARPLLTTRVIAELVQAARHADGALPALAVADTLKRQDDPSAPLITQSREGLWRAQTPQAFRRSVIEAAYAAWPSGEAPTDEASVVERHGGRVVLTPGDPRLLKLTYPEDFEMAEALAGAVRTTRI
ncbi:MAG: 2-C-methyl-D-erythritol 4-phosphate cytidylyltransferase, partial [Alphaproteobacteria bacterium]|nr:2-C-methyl-D-erythritol 4-phosphate cytidylyltransferase [Alphaproteobacteria bacterium]